MTVANKLECSYFIIKTAEHVLIFWRGPAQLRGLVIKHSTHEVNTFELLKYFVRDKEASNLKFCCSNLMFIISSFFALSLQKMYY